MSSLLPYNLFCLRKKFSIERYIKSFPDSSYEDFSNFLISRKVQPPLEEDFLKVKSTLPEKIDIPKEINNQEEATVKRRRRRTKKKDTNND